MFEDVLASVWVQGAIVISTFSFCFYLFCSGIAKVAKAVMPQEIDVVETKVFRRSKA